MQFGRLDTLPEELPLPPEDPVTTELLRESASSGADGTSAAVPEEPTVRIGLSTWGEDKYRGPVYPPETPKRDYLRAYAARFSTVELAGTFYGIPPVERLRAWSAAVPEDFRFLPKLSRGVTHRRKAALEDPEGQERQAAELRSFADRLAGLGDRLGPMLLQMSPRFAPRPENLAFLRQAAVVLGRRAAVELRNGAWFTAEAARRELIALLRESGAPLVVTDTPGAREVVHGILTAPVLVLRFVTAGAPGLDGRRARAWVARIRDWMDRGLSEAYLYMHLGNDPAGSMHVLETFEEGLSEARVSRAPAREAGQLRLFEE